MTSNDLSLSSDSQNQVTLETRQTFIQRFPCFAQLSQSQREQLANLMQTVSVATGTQLVSEDELVDCIYIIVEGQAEVTRHVKKGKKIREVPFAVLSAGDGIGLNDTGFYSTSGKRTATVRAITPMVLLRLDIHHLHHFLKENQLEHLMYAASLQMLTMRFIKQSLPFSKLSLARLQWLAEKVETMTVPAGTLIFQQGEMGDKCYLIRRGKVEIFTQEADQPEHHLATLKPPVLFGEATLVTDSPRNASARAVEECELLMLRHEYLLELLESENDVASMFVTLMLDRSRPLRNPHVTLHPRPTMDGQQIVILKNPDNHNYFKLSREGQFIWQHLDGHHTLQEITLSLAEKYNVFAPDMVAALISKLTKAGFISNLEIADSQVARGPAWARIFIAIRRILEARIALGDADPWITKTYQKYIHYLFSLPSQLILMLIAVAGLITFIDSTTAILHFFGSKHANLLLILGLLPLSLLAIILHELGHAFTVKAFKREVHYLGVGWYWFGPIAFTDTSDMWLANRKQRIIVNMAGIYVDLIVAALASLCIWIIPNPYVQAMLWLFALYTYIGGFRKLSPLQEMDGYYILMDWLEKPQLRKLAVIWLMKTFPASLKQPSLFRKHWAEVSYWLFSILYLFLVSVLTLVVQEFVFKVLDIQLSNPYVSLILPFLVVVFACFSIVADIRSQVEE